MQSRQQFGQGVPTAGRDPELEHLISQNAGVTPQTAIAILSRLHLLSNMNAPEAQRQDVRYLYSF